MMHLRRLAKAHSTQQKEMTNQSYISIVKCEDVHVCIEQLEDLEDKPGAPIQ